jgi:hypothetical protein
VVSCIVISSTGMQWFSLRCSGCRSCLDWGCFLVSWYVSRCVCPAHPALGVAACVGSNSTCLFQLTCQHVVCKQFTACSISLLQH